MPRGSHPASPRHVTGASSRLLQPCRDSAKADNECLLFMATTPHHEPLSTSACCSRHQTSLLPPCPCPSCPACMVSFHFTYVLFYHFLSTTLAATLLANSSLQISHRYVQLAITGRKVKLIQSMQVSSHQYKTLNMKQIKT